MNIHILVIGRHEEIAQTLLRIISKNEQWTAVAAMRDDEAISLFDIGNIDLVLLSSGLEDTSEKMLCQYFKNKQSNIRIIQHYGGGSGLLQNEIQEALEDRMLL